MNDLSPHGSLSQVYLWSRVLTNQDMKGLTANCPLQVNKTGTVFRQFILSIILFDKTFKLLQTYYSIGMTLTAPLAAVK